MLIVEAIKAWYLILTSSDPSKSCQCHGLRSFRQRSRVCTTMKISQKLRTTCKPRIKSNWAHSGRSTSTAKWRGVLPIKSWSQLDQFQKGPYHLIYTLVATVPCKDVPMMCPWTRTFDYLIAQGWSCLGIDGSCISFGSARESVQALIIGHVGIYSSDTTNEFAEEKKCFRSFVSWRFSVFPSCLFPFCQNFCAHIPQHKNETEWSCLRVLWTWRWSVGLQMSAIQASCFQEHSHDVDIPTQGCNVQSWPQWHHVWPSKNITKRYALLGDRIVYNDLMQFDSMPRRASLYFQVFPKSCQTLVQQWNACNMYVRMYA